MAITYSTTVKNNRLTQVVNALGATGKLEIGTTGMATVLVSIPLDNPAGTVLAGVLTLAFNPATVAAIASGVAAEARLRDGADVDVATGLTVGTAGTNVVLDNTNITSGQDVTINSGTITHG